MAETEKWDRSANSASVPVMFHNQTLELKIKSLFKQI